MSTRRIDIFPIVLNRYAFRTVFFLCSIISLYPIISYLFLPMLDLPQHAAQISILAHYDEPQFGFLDRYWFNFTTPYLLGIGLSGVIAKCVGVLASIKVVLCITLVLLPLSLYYFLRSSGGDIWWSLIGFPAFYGFNFSAGHYNFLFSLPLSFLFLGYLVRIGIHPLSTRPWIFLILFSVGLFYCHAISMAVTTSVAVVFLWLSARQKKEIFGRIMLSIGLFMTPMLWWLLFKETEPNFQENFLWSLDLRRFFSVFPMALGFEGGFDRFRISHSLIAAILIGSRLKLDVSRWGTFIAFCLLVGFIPQKLAGAAHTIYERVAVYIVPCLLLLLAPTHSIWRLWGSRALLFLTVFVSLVNTNLCLMRFDQEVGEFSAVIDRLQRNQNVLYLAFDRRSDAVGGNPYSHFGVWAQALKGGGTGYSYAIQPPQIARLKEEEFLLGRIRAFGLYRNPESVMSQDVKRFHAILVRSHNDRTNFLIKKNVPVQLILEKNPWWLYSVIHSSTPSVVDVH